MLFSTFSLKFYFGIKFFLTVFPNNSSFLFVCLFVCFGGGDLFSDLLLIITLLHFFASSLIESRPFT